MSTLTGPLLTVSEMLLLLARCTTYAVLAALQPCLFVSHTHIHTHTRATHAHTCTHHVNKLIMLMRASTAPEIPLFLFLPPSLLLLPSRGLQSGT